MNIPLKTSELVGKDGQVPQLGSMSGPASVAFTLPNGGISGPLNMGATGGVLAGHRQAGAQRRTTSPKTSPRRAKASSAPNGQRSSASTSAL